MSDAVAGSMELHGRSGAGRANWVTQQLWLPMMEFSGPLEAVLRIANLRHLATQLPLYLRERPRLPEEHRLELRSRVLPVVIPQAYAFK